MGEDAAARTLRSLRGHRQDREPGRPREIRHVVKVHAETERRLVLKAAERDVSVARLLVESALAGGADAARAKAELAGELYRVTRAVGKIGVNVNQIARATNASREAQAETAEAMREVQELCARLNRFLDDVQGPL